MTATEGLRRASVVQHVAQRCRSERSDDADGARMLGSARLRRRIEQAFGFQLGLELQEALVERAKARRPEPLHRELEAATRLVEADHTCGLDLHPLLELGLESGGAAAEHHAVDLRFRDPSA